MKKLTPHPNSTAARKWGRTTWTSHLDDERDARGPDGRAARRLFAAAHRARQRGEHDRAQALTRTAMRLRTTSITCG